VSVARKDDVLTVPNAALRFKPELSEKQQADLKVKMEARRQQREAERQAQGEAPRDQANPGSGQGRPQDGEGGGQRRQAQQIWILTDGKTIEPRFVRTGLTNGRITEVMGGDIYEGAIVVTGQNEANAGNRPQTTATPFGQRGPGGPGGGGGGPRGPR
jgi:HlyD family secretion protein